MEHIILGSTEAETPTRIGFGNILGAKNGYIVLGSVPPEYIIYDHMEICRGLYGYDTVWPPPVYWYPYTYGPSIGGLKSYGGYYTLTRQYLAFDTSGLTELPEAAEIRIACRNTYGRDMCSAAGLRIYYSPWGPDLDETDWDTPPLSNPATSVVTGPFTVAMDEEDLVFSLTDLSGINLDGVTYFVLAVSDESIVPVTTPMHDLDVYAEFYAGGYSLGPGKDPRLIILDR
jgi:hypothetical protein